MSDRANLRKRIMSNPTGYRIRAVSVAQGGTVLRLKPNESLFRPQFLSDQFQSEILACTVAQGGTKSGFTSLVPVVPSTFLSSPNAPVTHNDRAAQDGTRREFNPTESHVPSTIFERPIPKYNPTDCCRSGQGQVKRGTLSSSALPADFERPKSTCIPLRGVPFGRNLKPSEFQAHSVPSTTLSDQKSCKSHGTSVAQDGTTDAIKSNVGLFRPQILSGHGGIESLGIGAAQDGTSHRLAIHKSLVPSTILRYNSV